MLKLEEFLSEGDNKFAETRISSLVEEKTSELVDELNNSDQLEQLEKESIDNLSHYNDFKKRFEEFVNSIFIKHKNIENQDERILKALRNSNMNMYSFSEEEKETLRYYIMEKKFLMRRLFLNFIDKGVFNFDEDIVNSMKAFIESNAGEFFDEVYLNFIKNLPSQNLWGEDNEKFYYGGLVDGELGGYSDLSSVQIDKEKIKQIQFENIRNYLLGMVELIEANNYNYQDWIDLEEYECRNYSSDEQMIVISPMEQYGQECLIAPEIILHIRENTEFSSQEFADLSKRYFGYFYEMDRINLDISSGIRSGGDSTFFNFLGKTFPNDEALVDKYGANIVVVKDLLEGMVKENIPVIKRLLGNSGGDIDERREEMKEEFERFVVFHEYGHSLFRNGVDTVLEETKATLYYYVYLYDKFVNHGEELTYDYISTILYTFLLESRDIKKMHQEDSYEEFLGAQIIFYHFFDNGILSFDEDNKNLEINDDNLVENFKNTLKDLKELCEKFKDLYENKDMQGVKEIENYYTERMDKVSKQMYEVLN